MASSRRRILGRLLVSAIATLALTGCGSQTPQTTASAEAPNLLTDASIAQQLAHLRPDQTAPASAVLSFWRDIQFSNFPLAYAAMAPALQKIVTYKRFVRIFSRAVPYFLYQLRVQTVGATAGLTTVYCTVQTQSAPTPLDPPIAFNLREIGDSWRLVTDPRNILGTPLIARST